MGQKLKGIDLNIWQTVIIPLITLVVTSSASIGVAYISAQPPPQPVYKMSPDDQSQDNYLLGQINLNVEKYFQTSDPIEKAKLDGELVGLANQEAGIMRKYNPNYIPRWPILPPSPPPPKIFPWSIAAIVIVILTISSYFISRRILRRHYQTG
jgi:hypothetical protein